MLIWILYILRSGRDYDIGLKTRLHRAWRRIVFWGGDIRRISHFPWITWDTSERLISAEEALTIMKLIKAGDIGIHREKGFLSNLAIPGFMIHAWIHINESEDLSRLEIVEAISEGVKKRSALYPIYSDYCIILRPKNVTKEDINQACAKALKIVGCNYDVDFKFDIEEEIKIFGEKDIESQKEREILSTNLKAEWDGGFSCTETVSFSWWHKRKELQLFRQKARGKQVILADSMINPQFDIIWISKSVTPEVAAKFGLGEMGIEMIKDWCSKHSI